jgi:hypothetical protein
VKGFVMRVLYFLLATAITVSAGSLDYLNNFRNKAGLYNLNTNEKLQTAAENHSTYLEKNNYGGHYENSGDNYYTGNAPLDRVLYAGYPARYVMENVSKGQVDVYDSIDGLFAAIYHRFGFLSYDINEIGIGVNGKSYTYDMGNSNLRKLCENPPGHKSGSSYYKDVCKDTSIRIDSDDYNNAFLTLKQKAPEIIFWPPNKFDNILPAFYEESPDPLPNRAVSGYPISVEFNKNDFPNKVSVDEFTLTDANKNQLDVLLMDKDNDPNKRINSKQFVLFPYQHLDWGESYFVNLSYDYNNKSYTKKWCFNTKSLKDIADRYYKIDENQDEVTLKVISGKKYAIYLVPRNENDKFNYYSYSGSLSVGFIDFNTILVKVNGSSGSSAYVKLGNSRKINFTITTNSDNAIVPKESKQCINSSDTNVVIDDSSDDNSQTEDDSSDNTDMQDNTDTADSSDNTDTVDNTDNDSNINGDGVYIENDSGTYEKTNDKIVEVYKNGYTIKIDTRDTNNYQFLYLDNTKNTTVDISKQGTVIKLKQDDTTQILKDNLSVTVDEYGKVFLRYKDLVLPKSKLPKGTKVSVENDKIKCIVELVYSVEF